MQFRRSSNMKVSSNLSLCHMTSGGKVGWSGNSAPWPRSEISFWVSYEEHVTVPDTRRQRLKGICTWICKCMWRNRPTFMSSSPLCRWCVVQHIRSILSKLTQRFSRFPSPKKKHSVTTCWWVPTFILNRLLKPSCSRLTCIFVLCATARRQHKVRVV